MYNFDRDDLLRASTEAMGEVSMGTLYKATLKEGWLWFVKRLKDVI